jgi:hypothetical protein
MKTQAIRLLDVFLVGPVMVGVAVSKKPKPILKKSLIVLGFLTIIYNLRNYLIVNEQEKNNQSN